MYVVISIMLTLVYAIPALLLMPVFCLALHRLKKINYDLYKNSWLKTTTICLFLDGFLIWRIVWYFNNKFGEILVNGDFNSDLVFLFTGEVVLMAVAIFVQYKNLETSDDIVNVETALMSRTNSKALSTHASVLKHQSFIENDLNLIKIEISQKDQEMIRRVCQYIFNKHGDISVDSIQRITKAEIQQLLKKEVEVIKLRDSFIKDLPMLDQNQLSMIVGKLNDANLPTFGVNPSKDTSRRGTKKEVNDWKYDPNVLSEQSEQIAVRTDLVNSFNVSHRFTDLSRSSDNLNF